jgi:hypothetical protein
MHPPYVDDPLAQLARDRCGDEAGVEDEIQDTEDQQRDDQGARQPGMTRRVFIVSTTKTGLRAIASAGAVRCRPPARRPLSARQAQRHREARRRRRARRPRPANSTAAVIVKTSETEN